LIIAPIALGRKIDDASIPTLSSIVLASKRLVSQNAGTFHLDYRLPTTDY
jgi:hypothetical protein